MLFQKTIIKKYLGLLKEEAVSEAWNKFQAYFLDAQIQANIKQSKEEQFQEGFLRELFVNVLGYTLNPSPNYNLITEKKNETNSKKADGAILLDGKVIGVIELKDHNSSQKRRSDLEIAQIKGNVTSITDTYWFASEKFGEPTKDSVSWVHKLVFNEYGNVITDTKYDSNNRRFEQTDKKWDGEKLLEVSTYDIKLGSLGLARNTHSSQTTQQSSTLSDAEKAKMLQEVEAQQADFGLQK